MADSPAKRAMDVASRMLAKREHSRLEITRKLQQRDFDAAVIDEVVARCAQLDILSDRRFALMLVRSSHKKFGDIKLRYLLEQAGVDDALISEAMKAECTASEQTRAQAVLAARFRPPLDDKKTESIMRFLRARGFSHSAVRAALKNAKTDALAD